MLPKTRRLHRASQFQAVTRGPRARRGSLVVYLGSAPDATSGSRAGLIVGRSVGNSVVRHRVSRRLRAQLATRLDRLPAGSDVVVRALPPAAASSSDGLGRDLDAALDRLTAPGGTRARGGTSR